MGNSYKIKITSQAQSQLKEIAQYISITLQSPTTAVKMLDTLEKEILSLADLPNRIALIQEEPWRSQGIHKMTVKNYLVYFWVNEELHIVQITAVVYGRRDQKQLLAHMKMD